MEENKNNITDFDIKMAVLARNMQEDCHKIVEEVMKSSKASYQDATNVFIFHKLAKLELMIQELKDSKK